VTTVRTACALDCWDNCVLLVDVHGRRITGVRGDPDHEITQGFICRKAHGVADYTGSPERLRQPLRRTASGRLEPVTFEAAVALLAERLERARQRWGPESVLFYSGTGSQGILQRLDERFINLFGGGTTVKGSLCWSAGLAAQRRDFGAVLGHDPSDTANARTIILWGRNPAWTNIHLLPWLRRARRRGARVILIDPVRTASARFADVHLAPRPGTDWALALGVGQALCGRGLSDPDFLATGVEGFESYRRLADRFPPQQAAELCGVAAGDIAELAQALGRERPAQLLLGYGPQRYATGGFAVRAIDALGAVSGNIGVEGGGVNYANRIVAAGFAAVDDVLPATGAAASRRRTVPCAALAGALETTSDPRLNVMVCQRGNPLAQHPDAGRLQRALADLDFLCVIDTRPTATARVADLVIPCSTFYEREDLTVSSWHSYLTWGLPAVAPPPGVHSDLEIWSAVARELGCGDDLPAEPRYWLERLMEPLTAFGLTANELRGRSVRHPESPRVPWRAGEFRTPSGRFELVGEEDAVKLGLVGGATPELLGGAEVEGVVQAEDAGEAGPTTADHGLPPLMQQQASCLVLLTPRHRDTLHSQMYDRVLAGEAEPAVHLHPQAAAVRDVEDGQLVTVATERGSLRCRARLSEDVHPEACIVYPGGGLGVAPCVNLLTGEDLTDLGLGAAYYETRCRITVLE